MDIEEAIAQGRRNQEIVDLIRRHCSHAHVEITGGVGIVEEMTGLPIGHRTVRCSHAALPTFSAMQLESVAIDFYEKNCMECAHRSATGVPNLATHAATVRTKRQMADEGASEAQREAEQRLVEEDAGRRRHRAAIATGLAYGSARLIDLLDRIDTEKRDPAAERELEGVARAAPELFTEPIIAALFKVARATQSASACEAIRQLAHHRSELKIEAAVLSIELLSSGPHTVAGKLLVEFGEAASMEEVRRTIPALISLAADRDAPFARAPEIAPLMWAIQRDLHGVLERIQLDLSSGSTWTRRAAADAARRVAGVEPGTAIGLATQLIDAIEPGEYDEVTWPSESANPSISRALSACLVSAPTQAGDAFERVIAPGARQVVMRASDRVIRDRMSSEVPQHAGETAIRFAIRRLGGDWGRDSARAAADLLNLAGGYHPEVLEPFLGDLVGWLLIAADDEPTPYSPLLDTQQPNAIRALEADTARIVHRRNVEQIREAVGAISARSPDRVADHVFALLDGDVGIPDEPSYLRAELVHLLGVLGTQSSYTSLVLPYLYDALLGTDQLARAAAIQAWATIDRATDGQLSLALSDLIVPMLTDPYVIVHGSMIDALRLHGLRTPAAMRLTVANVVLRLALHYQDDARMLDHYLDVAVALIGPVGTKEERTLMRLCLHLAKSLHAYDKSHFLASVTWRIDDSLHEPFADLLLSYFEDPAHIDRFNQPTDDSELAMLTGLPAPIVRDKADRMESIATAGLPDHPHDGYPFIAVLQGAEAWSDASDLAASIASGVPADAEHRTRRLFADVIGSTALLEASISRGAPCDVSALDSLDSAIHEYTEAATAVSRSFPFG